MSSSTSHQFECLVALKRYCKVLIPSCFTTLRPCFVAVGSAALQSNGLPARVGLGRVQFLHPSDSGPAPLGRTSGNKAPHAPQQVNISTGPNDVCFKPFYLFRMSQRLMRTSLHKQRPLGLWRRKLPVSPSLLLLQNHEEAS